MAGGIDPLDYKLNYDLGDGNGRGRVSPRKCRDYISNFAVIIHSSVVPGLKPRVTAVIGSAREASNRPDGVLLVRPRPLPILNYSRGEQR